MNDVLNSEIHTDEAWRFHTRRSLAPDAVDRDCRQPAARPQREAQERVILPVIVSIPFFLIADIDSPRAGVIRVVPVNLIAHAQSMRPQQ